MKARAKHEEQTRITGKVRGRRGSDAHPQETALPSKRRFVSMGSRAVRDICGGPQVN